MKFTINTITFLSIILVTILCWIGFEWYHINSNTEIPQEVVNESKNPLPPSFDKDTLNKLYEGKSNFYTVGENQAN